MSREEEKRLLAALGASETPSVADKARVLGRLEAELGVSLGVVGALVTETTSASAASANVALGSTASSAASSGAPVSGAAATGAAGKAATSLLGVGWKWGAGVLLTLGAATAFVVAEPPSNEVESAPVVTHVPASAATPADGPRRDEEPARAEEIPLAPEPHADERGPESVVSPAPSVAPTSKGSAARESSIEGELVLVAEAQRALARGEADRALALVERHRASYPRGTLRVERAGIRVIALCLAGRVVEGRAEAARFLEKNGSSPLSRRIEKSCGIGD